MALYFSSVKEEKPKVVIVDEENYSFTLKNIMP